VRIFHWGWLSFCILSCAIFAFSQNANTSLRGTVKDPSGALIPGVKVALIDSANGKTLSAVANSVGFYSFPQIPPSSYTITVLADGFGRQSKRAELLVDQPATIDFILTVQASAVTVDVSSSAQTLNTADATLGDSVGNKTIEALPMEGRDPIALLTLQPGVLYLGNPAENDTTDSRSGSVSGGRSDQGNITLDGMDDNDQVNGTAFTGVLRSTLDSTEEFRVTTSNGNASSGRSSGAQVSLITKSGTNNYHGALYEYYRPTNTVANEWFNKYQELILGEPNIPQKYVMNTFGGAVGGPIKKDKLFFFANYEGQRKAIDEIITQTLPTQQFYNSQLGYQDQSGNNVYLTPAQVMAIDASPVAPCTPSIGCGPNANVIAYYQPVANKGFYGSVPTVGDGLNNAGFIFSSPAPSTLNTSIVKLDYNLTAHQQLFFRGNLQKDTQAGDENLPGQSPINIHIDNTKGLAFGHTWTPTANIVNDARYGYIRQGYSTRGIASGTGDWVDFRFLSQPTGQGGINGLPNPLAYTTVVNVPVQNITDNLTWNKGGHTLSFGGNWRGIQNNRGTDSNSYSSATTNPYWLSAAPNDPCVLTQTGNCETNNPSVGSAFQNSYEIAFDTLVGVLPESSQVYNYGVSSATSGTLFNDGTFINRHFKANEFEYYIQDSWRATPTITITYGLRHSLLQAPYESHGQQISPTVDTHDWYLKRGSEAAQGNVFEDPLSFAPSGKANHAPGFWPKQKDNIAPRLSVVFAPNARTTVRAGAGMYYDHFGQGIVNSFDQEGSFGLSNAVSSPASNYTVQNSPRFTGAHSIPPTGCPTPSQSISYPFTPISSSSTPVPPYTSGASEALSCGLAITWGIDNHIKTPYSYALDFSIQHQLPGGFIFEGDYVGRLGRHLLEQVDLAEPVNLVDSRGGGDYFTAAKTLSRIVDLNGGNGTASVNKIPYFEDMFPFMANSDYSGESATQAIYSDLWAPFRYGGGETSALYTLDLYDNPNGPQFDYYQSQFSSLFAWSSIGTSSYHAMQATLRHPSSHGFTTDLSYTWSKSLDMGSGAERSNEYSTDSFGGSGIQNTWNPKLNKGVSDFDTRGLVTFDWVYALPVGRGRQFLSGDSRILDAVLGGWQWSGLSRWASPLPFSVTSPGWQTNWQLEGWGVVTSPVKLHKHIVNGVPQVWAGNAANEINNGIYNGSPIRLPYPGEAGQRNNFRGDGYFDLDSALSKTWNLHEDIKLKFAGEVYNLTNAVRFDDSPINLNSSLTSGTFGAYGGMLTTYRRMQFGLRLDF
jgi:hypothetical protein